MDLLKLGALDEQDLQAISANMQDAVMRVGDIKYLAAQKQFAMVANRFNWERSEKPAEGYQRRRSGLHFNSVSAVRSSRIVNKADDAVLELLAIGFVSTFFLAVDSDRLGVGLFPCLGKQALVVGAASEQLGENVFDVQSRVQVVTASTADQGHHLGAPLAAGNARYE